MITCPRCGHENPAGNRFCGSCGLVLDATAEPTGHRQERKTITVLFADLVGFTSTAERLDPEDVRAMLSPYYARLREELERHGGTVEKFIGDAVVALFGAPAAHEDDPERAVRAALAIRDWIVESSGELQVRIAVNTGEALVTIDAQPSEGEGMAAGDVVNTAARLQSAAPVNGILVGEATYRATAQAIEYREADALDVKGKRDSVPVWVAVQARSRFGVDVVQAAASPMVGRDRELGLLIAALERVMEERSPQLVTIVGVPGIGKSRLVYELFEHVDRDSARLVTWRQGRSLPYGEGVAFWAFAEMVKAQTGILESDTPDQAREKLRRLVWEFAEDDTERQWMQDHLAPLVGLGTGEQGGEEAFPAWRRFLEALAQSRPVVLVFEDLHWADNGVLDFVEYLADWVTGVPLLVVGTARPELFERRPGWGGGKPNAVSLSLSPLSDDDTARLVAALLERSVLPAALQQALLERIGGNPLYAEQFVRMVTERGLSEETPLPETVQGIIAARLDGLPEEEKDLLRGAAVMGKVFWLGAAVAVSGTDARRAELQLHALERKEFLRRAGRSSVAGETEFVFRHILLRDVAYGQIPRASRSEKHRRAAEWIESLGRPEDHAEFVAHHYSAALEFARAAGIDDPTLVQRAMDSFELAADRAMSLGSFSTAASLYSRALELSTPDDPRHAVLLARGGYATFSAEGSGLDMIRDAVARFLDAGDEEGAAEWAAIASRVAWYRGDRDTAYELIERAVGLVEGRPPSRAKALALSQRSAFYLFEGDHAAALPVAEEGLMAAEAVGLEYARVRAMNVIGTGRAMLGDPEGIPILEKTIAVAREAGEFDQLHGTINNLALMLLCEGRARESSARLDELAESVERYGKAHDRTWTMMMMGSRLYREGRWDDSLRNADELIARVEAGMPDYQETTARVVRTSILLGRGDLAGAEAESKRAVTAGRKAKDVQLIGPALMIRAIVALAGGGRQEAKTLVAEVLSHNPLTALMNEYNMLPEAAILLLDLDELEELSGLVDSMPPRWPWVDAGRAILSGDLLSAADVMAAMPYPLAEALLRLRAAEELMEDGRREDTEHQLELVVPFFRQAGAIGYLRRAEALSATGAQAG